MAKNVETVTGTVSADALGVTSMHEHVPLERAGKWRTHALEFAVADLRRAKSLGLTSIVEVSPRRDVRGIREVSERSGVIIVVCTGFYDYTEEEKRYDEETFYRRMMSEIDDGIDGTDIRPGVIKVRGDKPDLTPYEIKAFRAAGRAQATSGLPVCTHAVSGCRNQQDILEEAGADLSRVYFSHTEAEFGWEGRSLEQEIAYLKSVVAKGSTLSYNNFGNWAHTKPESLAAIIKALIEAGFADRQVATMDLIWDYDEQGRQKILWADINTDGPRRTYSYLMSDVVPWLRSVGVTEADIRRMIVDTPRRLLAGS